MPFRSEAQRRFMYAKHPSVARRWQEHTPTGKLPARVEHKAGGGAVGALSTLADLAKYLKQFRKGDRSRVERALQYAPDLPRQIKPEAVAYALDKGPVAPYDPSRFERLAAQMYAPGTGFETPPSHESYINELTNVGPFNEMPFLRFSWIPSAQRFQNPELDDAFSKVIGHEGRHRSRAMARRSEPASLLSVQGGPDYTFRSLNDLLLPQADSTIRSPVRAGEVFFSEPFKHGGEAKGYAGGGIIGAGKGIRDLWKLLKDEKALTPEVKKRFENMAMSAPNMPELYDARNVAMGLTQPKQFAFATMDPKHYEHLAYPIESRGFDSMSPKERTFDPVRGGITKNENLEKHDRETIEFLRGLLKKGRPFQETPFLQFSKTKDPDLWSTWSHNGRHRMRAMAAEGLNDVPIELQRQWPAKGRMSLSDEIRKKMDRLELHPEGAGSAIMYRDIFSEPFKHGGLTRVSDSTKTRKGALSSINAEPVPNPRPATLVPQSHRYGVRG